MIKLNAYKDQVIGVFGLGKAGLATVQALVAGGAKVVAWDDSEEGRKAVQALNLDVRLHNTSKWPWDHMSLVVLSPGVPLNYPEPHPVVKDARLHCCPVVGDIELLYQAQPHATYVTITGTNGKSTTTTLIGHILKHAGKKVQIGGNIGTAALSLEPLDEDGIYVLELSSYQLDLVATTRFDIALMLNISPDHIDRHGSIDGYVAAKMHMFDHQTEYDQAIIAIDDAYTRGAVEDLRHSPATLTTVTTTNEDADLAVVDGMIRGQGHVIDLNKIRSLQGRHNWQNAISAYAVARALKVDLDVIDAAMGIFPGLEHRMEWVRAQDNITFINDSKATNANAASYALGAWDNIYWILGGVAKEGGINTLHPYFSKVKRAYLIGEAQNSFAETLGGEVMHSKCTTLEQALTKAYADAMQESPDGATILFSPACASFDQYKNFEARGRHFKELVGELLDIAGS